MAETRKKLTETQVKQITFTQQRKAQAEASLRLASEEADRVLALVFDAVGIPSDAKEVSFDETTNELVVGAAPGGKKPRAAKSVNGG